jgi:hypothetical protein
LAKTGGHNRLSRVILHCDDGGDDIEGAIGVSQSKFIAELQSRVALKQNFVWSAKFDGDTFGERSGTVGAARNNPGKLKPHPYWRRVEKETRESRHRAGVLRVAYRCCGWMRQAMKIS